MSPSRSAVRHRLAAHLLICGLIGGGLLLTPTRSPGFNSYAPEVHSRITAEAAKSMGFWYFARRYLSAAVKGPDWNETSVTYCYLFGLIPYECIRPNSAYRPTHHFDRARGAPTSLVFVASAAYMRGQFNEAVNYANAGMYRSALKSLGRALHALEDFFAHSNYVDLNPFDQIAVRQALASGQPPPGSLMSTGYDPHVQDPESPPGDPYCHKDYAKDKSNKNHESHSKIGRNSKYWLARRAATLEACEWLRTAVRDKLDPVRWYGLTHSFVPLTEDVDVDYAWSCTWTCSPDEACVDSCYDTTIEFPAGAFAAPETLTVLAPPSHPFYTIDEGAAADGRYMTLCRELDVQPDSARFTLPGRGSISFPDSAIAGLEGFSLGVFFNAYHDVEDSTGWVPVPGAVVDTLSRVATFPVTGPGLYAIGGLSRVPAEAGVTDHDGGLRMELEVFPNPSGAAGATIQFRMPSPGPVRLDVHDASGRLVRTLVDETPPSGQVSAIWDGRNASGRLVAPGVYFVQIRSGSWKQTRRFTFVR